MVCVAIALAAMLQDTGGVVPARVSVTVAAVWRAQRVPAISSHAYAGPGAGIRLRRERASMSSRTEWAIEGEVARLTTDETSSATSDRIGSAALSWVYVKAAGHAAEPRVFWGLAARIGVAGDRHQYPDATLDFWQAALMAGLAVRAELPWRHAHLIPEIRLPLLGVGAVPYAAGGLQWDQVGIVTPFERLAIDARLTLRPARRTGWIVQPGYELQLVRESRYDVRRYARQAITVTIARGRRP